MRLQRLILEVRDGHFLGMRKRMVLDPVLSPQIQMERLQ